ncbi:MAG: NAD(P)H-dependent oxidoreductase subunit E [Hydrogenophilus sp.]|nr:NAD(P)H-dependent oxidoreductase subunit E [Hydrogenophilus sp.]
MSYYLRHVFFCCNQRPDGETCCAQRGAEAAMLRARDQLASLAPELIGKIRINRAGCLGRCDRGPLLVVYPDAIWYSYLDHADIDEIVREHLIGGRVVERLRFADT